LAATVGTLSGYTNLHTVSLRAMGSTLALALASGLVCAAKASVLLHWLIWLSMSHIYQCNFANQSTIL